MASQLISREQVEVLCHHDADGIAAGSIMSIALYRAHIPFRLRLTSRVQRENLPKGGNILLCDLGSGLPDLPEETMVIDHHLSSFEGPWHVNPRLAGIDGDTELSGAGAAYIVANALGNNRDLAGLVLTGIMGDGQQLTGKNLDICLEGMGNGVIAKKRGIRLAGRDIAEQLTLATDPYLPGISGKEQEITDLISRCSSGEETPAIDLLLSSLVIGAAEFSRPEALLNLYGDIYHLEREVIEDAHTMTMIIDACGKEGEGSIAAAICLRSSRELPAAWEIARNHRMKLFKELEESLATGEKPDGVYEISDKRLASDVADTISGCMERKAGPVMVVARQDDGNCHISIRISGIRPGRSETDLGTRVHTLAQECGGYGGGHTTRAGATIAGEHLSRFIAGISGEYA